MGSWGVLPWDNDAAADWFSETMQESKLALIIERTLNLNVEENADEIRAAASMLVLLGRTYVWPVKKLESNLNLAIKKLTEISQVYDFENEEEYSNEVKSEIEILKSRLPQSATEVSSSSKSTWSFWI